MTPFLHSALYGAILLAVAAYTVWRAGLRFTARGCFLCFFLLLFGVPHLMYQERLDAALYGRITAALVLMWVGIIAGMETVRLVARRSARRADGYARTWRHRRLPLRQWNDRTTTMAICLAALFLATVTVYENPLAKLSAFLSLSGDTNAIAELRFTQGASKVYLYNLLIASIGPFLSFVAVLRAARGRRLSSCLLAAIMVGLVAIGKAGLLNRSALPIYLIQLVMIALVARNIRIRLRMAATVFGLAALLVYPFYYHYLGAIDLGQFLRIYFWDRILLAPYYGMLNYFSTFPEHVPFAIGRNFTLINWLFYNDPDYVPAMFLFAQQAGNYQGAYNAMFIAEAWADFGYYGILVESLVLGASLATVDLWIFSRGKTSEGVAAIVAVMYGIVVLSSTALQTALFSGGIVLVPALCLMLQRVRNPRFVLRFPAKEAAVS